MVKTILEAHIRYKIGNEDYKWGFYYAQCFPNDTNVTQMDFVIGEGNTGDREDVKWHVISAVRNKRSYSITAQTYDTPPFDISRENPFAVTVIVGNYVYVKTKAKRSKSAVLVANIDGKEIPLFGLSKWSELPRAMRKDEHRRPFVIFTPDPKAQPGTCFLPGSSFPGKTWGKAIFQFRRDFGKDSIGVTLPKSFHIYEGLKVATISPAEIKGWDNSITIPGIRVSIVGSGSSTLKMSGGALTYRNEWYNNLLELFNDIGYMVTGVAEVGNSETYGAEYLAQITSPKDLKKEIVVFLQNIRWGYLLPRHK